MADVSGAAALAYGNGCECFFKVPAIALERRSVAAVCAVRCAPLYWLLLYRDAST